MERDFQAMKKRHSDACADRDNMTASYKQVCASLGTALEKLSNAEAKIKNLENDLEKANETVTLRERQFVDMGRKMDELSAEATLYRHAKREVDEWKEVADDLADTVKDLRDQLASAHKRIEEQQRTIVDCSDTITTLKTTAELRPQFSNLWQLLKETGMIVNTEGGIHNHE
jgi:predicted  nucleic acid-binding Zn-ribbon protein